MMAAIPRPPDLGGMSRVLYWTIENPRTPFTSLILGELKSANKKKERRRRRRRRRREDTNLCRDPVLESKSLNRVGRSAADIHHEHSSTNLTGRNEQYSRARPSHTLRFQEAAWWFLRNTDECQLALPLHASLEAPADGS